MSKGLRRLEQLCAGEFKRSAGLIGMLPAALEVPVDVIKQTVEETQRYLRESDEAAWRAAFRPHAIILTERQRPEPLFVAAFIGVEVLLRVDFDLNSGPVTFLQQTPDGLRQRLERWHGYLLCYGCLTLILAYDVSSKLLISSAGRVGGEDGIITKRRGCGHDPLVLPN